MIYINLIYININKCNNPSSTVIAEIYIYDSDRYVCLRQLSNFLSEFLSRITIKYNTFKGLWCICCFLLLIKKAGLKKGD